MREKKKEIGESCGLTGQSARVTIRSLLAGGEVVKTLAKKAVVHIEGCGFCKLRIKSSIYQARKEKVKTPYLYSLGETLQEAKRRAGID